MATRACCSFAAPSDARGVRAQRVATTKEPRLPRPLPGPVSMRLAARALVSRLAPLGGADALARVGGNACRSRAPVVSATDHRSFGAKSAGADEINSRLTQGTGTTFVHREPPDALRTSRGDTDALDARRASASSAVSASQRQWTSAPTSATSAPRAPIPAPADGPRGPSFELWGPDETSSGSGAGAGAAGAVAGIPPRGRTPSRIESPSFVTLRGEINRVTFHNADNFYTVARVRVAVSDVSLLPIGATATPAGPEGTKYNKYKKRAKGKGKGKGDTEKVVTVVGHIPGAAEGACLEMTGDWRDVEKWGTQFVLNATPKEIVPTDEESMLRYLAGGVLPGVGKATAEKLVAHFGAAVFETLDSRDAERKLKQCPGIGEKTAEKLARSWQFSRGRRDACLFLEQHGVEAGLAQRVAACYGAQTEQKVTEDPFNALSGIPGATFHRCDALAARLGKAPDAEPRLAAAMLRVLHLEATREGHVFVNWGVLTEGVAKLVGPKQAAGLRGGALEAAADLLLKRGNIAVARNRKVTQQGRLADDSGGTLDDTTEEEETETFAPTAFAGAKTADSLSNRVSFWNSSVVAAAALHDAEAFVALDIALRLQKPKRDPDVPRVRRWLQAAATKEGWRLLSPAQEAFLDLALREPISVLTGGPGTGKTFATHIAVRLWRAMGKNVLMCAPTGRAAQRLAEIASAGRNMSAPVQSSTIHRLLEYGGGARANNNDDRDGHDTHQNSESHDELTYKDKFARNAQNPLDADIVVVDESSMLDLPLCAALLDAIKQNAQVVFVGDADQLPSVGPGSVLRDILASGAVPAVQLIDVFRQAEQSGIIRAAHAINAGLLPEIPRKRWDPLSWGLIDEPETNGLGRNEVFGTEASSGTGGDHINPSTKSWATADCAWITLTDDSPAGYEGALEQLFAGAFPAFAKLDPRFDVQVLTPFRRGPASTSQLNSFLQAKLNPPSVGRLETKGPFDTTLREGDRVLQQRNDYTKEVFNGDLGTIVAVDGNGTVRVVFGGSVSEAKKKNTKTKTKEEEESDPIQRALDSLEHGARTVTYTKTELRDLIPAWALTVHKAQGSEYRAVVLCLAAHHRPLLRRELVYTAVSRAKEALVVLAPPFALQTAVGCVGNDRRVTTLARRLKPLAPVAPSCPATAAIAAAKDAAERRAELAREAEETLLEE